MYVYIYIYILFLYQIVSIVSALVSAVVSVSFLRFVSAADSAEKCRVKRKTQSFMLAMFGKRRGRVEGCIVVFWSTSYYFVILESILFNNMIPARGPQTGVFSKHVCLGYSRLL